MSPLVGLGDGFRVKVRSVRLSAGAGFVVALLGEIMTMPGLSKSRRPNACGCRRMVACAASCRTSDAGSTTRGSVAVEQAVQSWRPYP